MIKENSWNNNKKRKNIKKKKMLHFIECGMGYVCAFVENYAIIE